MKNIKQAEPLNLAIVGKGAIGSLIASQCDKLNYDYQLLLRDKQTLSLQVERFDGQQHKFTPKISQIDQPNKFDLVILPIKVYQVSGALNSLQNSLQPAQVIVLLHNGMGTIEEVQKRFPHNPCIAGTTSYGAYKPSEFSSKETGLGETHLGWITAAPKGTKQQVENLLSNILPPTTWHTDITLALWRKLTINAVINPLTAIHQIQNGQLLQTQYAAQITKICSEISLIMQAIGYSETSAELVELVMAVAEKTANNFSSMHQDIQHKRRTEIEFINGYVIKVAEKLGLRAEENNSLLRQVIQLETNST
ncbi:ketopantoate reductase family protein [Paraglaciecola sp. L3A3]|uniref:ketopantoate reductase family protein n=1 Tax=Paraglaciecola sp. L3A3 TaxID=2686358 RepID=UPI00131C6A29|nr:2-dehydropantoate 2-reductase [Paraglaciecola sp. L3A3]